jgi:hypothetical protein
MRERFGHVFVPYGLFTSKEHPMKISFVLAALATIAFAGSAAAEDKPMMNEGMHMHHHHHMHMHHHHHHHHMMHMMKKEGM